MREVLKFEPNQPQVVALEFPTGVNVHGQHGPYVRFSLLGNRMMFLAPDVAHAIKTLGVSPGEPFTVTRRTEPGRRSWWDVARVRPSGSSQAAPAASRPDSPAPGSKNEPSPVSATGPGGLTAVPDRIQGKPAAQPPPPDGGLRLTRTPPVKPSYEEAFRECLRIVRDGLDAQGERWGEQSVQAMVSTLMIQAGRDGKLGTLRAPRERAA
jgi:hypothetical protein